MPSHRLGKLTGPTPCDGGKDSSQDRASCTHNGRLCSELYSEFFHSPAILVRARGWVLYKAKGLGGWRSKMGQVHRFSFW